MVHRRRRYRVYKEDIVWWAADLLTGNRHPFLTVWGAWDQIDWWLSGGDEVADEIPDYRPWLDEALYDAEGYDGFMYDY